MKLDLGPLIIGLEKSNFNTTGRGHLQFWLRGYQLLLVHMGLLVEQNLDLMFMSQKALRAAA